MFNIPNPTPASGRDPKPISVFYASPILHSSTHLSFCTLLRISHSSLFYVSPILHSSTHLPFCTLVRISHSALFYASPILNSSTHLPFCTLPNINFNITRPSHSHVQTLNFPRTRYWCFLLSIQSSQLLFNCFHCVNISVAYTTLCEPREHSRVSVPGIDKRLISFLKQPDRL